MSNVQRLLDLQNAMTLVDGLEHPGAKQVFSDFHRLYGLPGIEALYDAGYSNAEALWIFYKDVCFESIAEMARHLDLT